MIKVMRRAFSCVLVMSVISCATVSDVVQVGPEKWMVGSHVRGGLTSWAEVKAMAVRRASDFCAARGQVADVQNIETAGAQGWTPQNADVTFACVKAAK